MRRLSFLIFIVAVATSALSQDSDQDAAAALDELTELLSAGLSDRADQWICAPTSQHVCSQDGCAQGEPSVSVQLNFVENEYGRCDDRGCDTYRMSASKGGIYTSVELPGRSTFLKALNDGSSYVEVATSGVAVIQNFGACAVGGD